MLIHLDFFIDICDHQSATFPWFKAELIILFIYFFAIWCNGTSCKHNINILPPCKVYLANVLTSRCLFAHSSDTVQQHQLFIFVILSNSWVQRSFYNFTGQLAQSELYSPLYKLFINGYQIAAKATVNRHV